MRNLENFNVWKTKVEFLLIQEDLRQYMTSDGPGNTMVSAMTLRKGHIDFEGVDLTKKNVKSVMLIVRPIIFGNRPINRGLLPKNYGK